MSSPNDGHLFLPLDVNFFDDPEVLAAGERAGWLYLHMLTLAKRTLSDGIVADVQVRKFGLGGTPARLAALEREGLIERRRNGWLLPSFLKRNRTAAEIKETQRLEREAAALGNHRRWHADKKSARCDYCTGRLADPIEDPTRLPDRVPDLPPESTETETRSETETKSRTRTRTGSSLAEPPAPARDEIFDALCDSCSIRASELTTSQRGALNKACKELKAVGATPDEVRARVTRYRTTFAGMNLTPNALARHWATLAATAPEARSDAVAAPRSHRQRLEDDIETCDRLGDTASAAALRDDLAALDEAS